MVAFQSSEGGKAGERAGIALRDAIGQVALGLDRRNRRAVT
jgi:hypothetical protein